VEIATACDVPTAAVGRAADREGIRVSECQLGLFGYEAFGEKRWVRRLAAIPRSLESEILAACVEDRLACAAAWRVADGRGVPRLVVGSVAEALDVRISACQLGCFE
jgi:hypothetical protein